MYRISVTVGWKVVHVDAVPGETVHAFHLRLLALGIRPSRGPECLHAWQAFYASRLSLRDSGESLSGSGPVPNAALTLDWEQGVLAVTFMGGQDVHAHHVRGRHPRRGGAADRR